MLRELLLLAIFRGIGSDELPQLLEGLTTVLDTVDDHDLNIEEMPYVANFGDAEHRGAEWYSSRSSDEAYKSDLQSDVTSETELGTSSADDQSSTGSSDEASSQETKEKVMATRVYRTCTPCPHDMMKKYSNKGIKWVCGGYQRARRSFKSECMMRYRNCQDGTMFIKYYDHRCKNDTYHGRHWFYIYKV